LLFIKYFIIVFGNKKEFICPVIEFNDLVVVINTYILEFVFTKSFFEDIVAAGDKLPENAGEKFPLLGI